MQTVDSALDAVVWLTWFIQSENTGELSSALAGFVIQRSMALFYDAMGYKSIASLTNFAWSVNYARKLLKAGTVRWEHWDF
jgi:hypothetical protein